MISYDLWTKKELIERLIILENDLVAFGLMPDVSEIIMNDYEKIQNSYKKLGTRDEMDKCKR